LDPDRLGSEGLGSLKLFGLLHSCLLDSFCGLRGCLCLLTPDCGAFGFKSCTEPFTFAWHNVGFLSVLSHNSWDEVILGASCTEPGGFHFLICFGKDFPSPACIPRKQIQVEFKKRTFEFTLSLISHVKRIFNKSNANKVNLITPKSLNRQQAAIRTQPSISECGCQCQTNQLKKASKREYAHTVPRLSLIKLSKAVFRLIHLHFYHCKDKTLSTSKRPL